jgi:hypothetical protein
VHSNPETCVWFQDLRFTNIGTGIDWFRFGLCRKGDGPWKRYRQVGDSARTPFN